MTARKHWWDPLTCHLCGKEFKTEIAEAFHRHNARILCEKYPKHPKDPPKEPSKVA